MKILSDNAAIEKNLRTLENAIYEYGGALDPDLVIACEQGSLSVQKHGFATPGKPMIALPGELLLPTEKMGLSVKNGAMESHPEKGALTDIQRKMTDCMLEIYNLGNKIELHKQASCWFAFRDSPETLEKLLKARTVNKAQEKFLEFTRAKGPRADEDEMLCNTYIKTRTIGHKQVKTGSEDVVMTTDIMPIVDFINHHTNGSYFSFRKNEDDPSREALMVLDSRPLPSSNECFAFYNQMDALDSFLTYGFPDSYAPYLRSVPLEFEIPKTGTLKVHAMQSPMHKGTLPQNAVGLRPYIPHTVRTDPNTLEITHLMIPANAQAPHALRRVLRLLISNRVASRRTLTAKEIWECVLAAEEKIIHTNIAFYKDLIAGLSGKGANIAPEKARLEDTVKYLAELQLTKLYKYTFEDKNADSAARPEEKEEGRMAAAE